jgi:hypothetical protein
MGIIMGIIPFLTQMFLLEAAGDAVNIIGSSKDVGVIGMLGLGIVALWKQTRIKDEALLKMAETVTAAMTTAATSNQELRKIIEEAERTRIDLAASIKELTIELRAKPCLVDNYVVDNFLENRHK